MVPHVGYDPTTKTLESPCSTTELMQRNTGLSPACSPLRRIFRVEICLPVRQHTRSRLLNPV